MSCRSDCPTPADHDLLRAYASGDHAAFATLLARHERMVYSAALRIVGTPDLARDAAQETFLLLARRGARLSPRVVVAGWLYLAACHQARKQLRAMQRRRHHENAAANDPSTAVAEAADNSASAWAELAPRLDAALAALPARLREAIILHHLQDLPRPAVAASLGCSDAALDKRLARGLARLRTRLARPGTPALSTVALAALLSRHGSDAHAATLAHATLEALPSVVPVGWFASLGFFGKSVTITLALGGLIALGGASLALQRQIRKDQLRAAVLATLPVPSQSVDGASVVAETHARPAAPRSRFTHPGAFSTFQRRLLQAATVDEAEAMLREIGITASKRAIAIAFAKTRDFVSGMDGREVDSNAASIAWPYFDLWLQEDVAAASRWILVEWPQPYDWVLDWTFDHWEKDPAGAANLLGELRGLPGYTRIQAMLLVRVDPRSALEFLRAHSSDFSRFTSNQLHETALRKLFAQDSAAAYRWLSRPENTSLALVALEGSTGLGALSKGSYLSAAQARELAESLPSGQQARGREMVSCIAGLEALQTRDFAAALDHFRAGGDSGRLMLEHGGALSAWAAADPVAAQTYVSAQGAPDLALALGSGWAAHDFAAAYDWALGAPPAWRDAALAGVLRSVADRDPSAALRLVDASSPGNSVALRRDLFGPWADRDPSAASAWLLARPADSERAALARDYANRLAYKAPEQALELLASTGTALDAALARSLAKGLAHRTGEAPADFLSALADRPELLQAAQAGVAGERFRSDPEAALAQLRSVQSPSQADLSLYFAIQADLNLLSEQPAATAAVLDRVDTARVPHDAHLHMHRKVARYWAMDDPDAALLWAVTLRDPALAAPVRASIESVLSSPSPAQKALLDRLPSSAP